MDINDLTVGQAKELASLFQNQPVNHAPPAIHPMIGKKVIIRTFSAGVWFGVLAQKDGKEVIVEDARRMWRWWAAKSISLSGVALYGIKRDKSKIAPAVPGVWLEAVEIIPCSNEATESIQGAPDVEAS